MPKTLLSFVLLLVASIATPMGAQDNAPQRLRLFFDCATHCDREYLRTEVTVIDWVTDQEASDVYVLATSQQTGAGGNEVVLEFIGRGELDGMTDRHMFTTSPDASLDDFRSEMARVLRLGLVRYLLQAGQDGGITLVQPTTSGVAVSTVPTVDPWNFWIFNVKLDGQLNAESRRKQGELELDLGANRITDKWKIRINGEATIDRTEFELDDGDSFTASRDRWWASALVAKSMGPHWSIGVKWSAGASDRDNLSLRNRIAPAIEYDIFPYSEFSRRRLILQYTLGLNRYKYDEETIFDKLEETRLDHQFKVQYRTRQPWGEAHLNGSFSAWADDLAKNRISFSTGLDIRITKGLSFEVDGKYSKVRNQLGIPKGDATDEEIFLELRQLRTDYEAEVKVGISYTFGSFLNSVVNSRFDESH